MVLHNLQTRPARLGALFLVVLFVGHLAAQDEKRSPCRASNPPRSDSISNQQSAALLALYCDNDSIRQSAIGAYIKSHGSTESFCAEMDLHKNLIFFTLHNHSGSQGRIAEFFRKYPSSKYLPLLAILSATRSHDTQSLAKRFAYSNTDLALIPTISPFKDTIQRICLGLESESPCSDIQKKMLISIIYDTTYSPVVRFDCLEKLTPRASACGEWALISSLLEFLIPVHDCIKEKKGISLWVPLGFSYFQSAYYEKAIPVFINALSYAQHAEQAEIHYWLAMSYKRLSRGMQALVELHILATTYWDVAFYGKTAYLELGRLFETMGKLDSARYWYQKTLDIDDRTGSFGNQAFTRLNDTLFSKKGH